MRLLFAVLTLSAASMVQSALAPSARRPTTGKPSPLLQPQPTRTEPLGMVGAIFGPEEVAPAMLQSASKVALSPMEVLCLCKCEELYNQGLALKCPWMRRRMLDAVDTIEIVARSIVVQPKHLAVIGPPIGLRGDAMTDIKHASSSINDVADMIRQDWREDTSKGYYITGALTPSVYRDDCHFDGPDPDMPIKGLRKFRGAASQLFDRSQSSAELLSLNVEGKVVIARWRLNGVLRLPFRPKMPEVVGTTTYHLDDSNLVYQHKETWQISAVEAFCKTNWFGRKQSEK